MEEIWFYGYAEDELSCAVMRRLFVYCNKCCFGNRRYRFLPGFPVNKRGAGNLKKIAPSLLNMAKNPGLYVFILTDLDEIECAPSLIRKWFPTNDPLPGNLLFRVAEREVESWLLADRNGLASFLGIAAANFCDDPDTLPDPKRHLLDVIQKKGRRRFHKDMLPSDKAHVGPRYNQKMREFVEQKWDITTAQQRSSSLCRTINSLRCLA